jgi:LysM repeat protein
VQIGIALLLLMMAVGALWVSVAAAVPGQGIPLPIPTADLEMQPVLLPTVTPSGNGTGRATREVTREATSKPVSEVTKAAGITDSVALSASAGVTASADLTATSTPTYYVVLPGDTLFVIAKDFGTTMEAILAANGLSNPDILNVGQVLLISAADGELPDPLLMPVVIHDVTTGGTLTQTMIAPRATITERMTSLAQQAPLTSPFHNTTWLTYYGRPNIDVMGILGEYSIEDLVPRLRDEAAAYEHANGDSLMVKPAFHLVYGMATAASGDDDSHLAYMSETEVISYITAADAEGWGVILDVQIGALSPTLAISPALAYLQYPNVHLAIDPEFAMAHKNQVVPGNPIGFVTAEQVNDVQALINAYLEDKRLPSPRILLVHQFQSDMIVEPEKLDTTSYPHVALTLSVDGWGGPWGKISKYNSLVTKDSPYTAFKLFYRWDEPLLLPDEALGNLPYRGSDFAIDVTPNLIIYQ